MKTTTRNLRHLMQKGAERCRGFTMVELLVGVAIGLFLVGVAATVFVASRHSFQVQDNVAHMQESARAVVEDITREIRKAGSFGCYRIKDSSVPGSPNAVPFMLTATMPAGGGGNFPLRPITPQSPVQGQDVTVGPNPLVLPGGSGVTPALNTDYVSVMYGQPVATLDLGGMQQMTNFQQPYTLNRNINVSSGQPMAVADCNSMTIFRVDNAGDTNTLMHFIGGGNNLMPADVPTMDPLMSGNVYKSGSIVMWLEMPTFFVGTDGSGTTSLYRWDSSNGGGIQPMIPNVEQMRVVFGVDAGAAPGHLNAATAWMSGAQVSSLSLWGNVVSVTVHLVLRSDESGGAGTAHKNFAWDSARMVFVENTLASDQYLRQVYVINAALRTRVPIMN